MLLCCDVGNTNTKLIVYKKQNRAAYKVFPNENISLDSFKNFGITNAAISSVVSEKTKMLSDYIQKELKVTPYIINHKSNFNLAINYKTPETLGIDRICATEGAYSLYRKENPIINDLEKFYLLIIDFGTATTLNFVNYNSMFEGGIILPGIKTMIDSLNKNTAQLPKIDLSDYISFIGKDTRSSIASGILNSTISLIEKAYNHLTNFAGTEIIKIYLTGGNAGIIQPFIRYENILVDDLVLLGVKSIFERNRSE
ncbi:MAG: type III pantothenate kinase [Ignavibacteriales bacterium]|nr:type III pantothenate kinase [Ignavibacteriales bacterium]